MNDDNYLYHLTVRPIAIKIKSAGMTSALTRIGTTVANPHGSFAQNRKKKESVKFEQKVKAYLCDLLSRGCTKEKIISTKGQYTPFAFAPVGSNDIDVPKLSKIEDAAFKKYLKLIPNIASANRVKKMQYRKDTAVAELSRSLLLNNKNHFLVRLAVQYVSFSYKIEETITASHVYFLTPKYAKDGFNSYKVHLNSDDIVVLRVNKNNILGLKDDNSDHRAKMTKQTVTPNNIEIMLQTEGFVEMEYRCNESNWQALADLV